MASRTPEGKHTPRYIVLKKILGEEKYTRSASLSGYYLTRAGAEAAVAEVQPLFPTVQYKIRQK